MIKFTNIQIGRVSNGWVVMGSPGGGSRDEAMVVKDEEDLAGAIAAALVAEKFKVADAGASPNITAPSIFTSGLLGATNSVATNTAGSLEDFRVRWEEQQRQRDEAAELQRYAYTHVRPYVKDPLV
jgi:hypothetical protein